MLSPNDLNWLAGFIEGEGYFGYNDTPRFVVGSTDKDVIERASRILGQKITLERRRRIDFRIPDTKLKDMYRISICAIKAIGWMMTLYSLMGLRRKEKIREIITIWKSRSSYGVNQRRAYERKSVLAKNRFAIRKLALKGIV